MSGVILGFLSPSQEQCLGNSYLQTVIQTGFGPANQSSSALCSEIEMNPGGSSAFIAFIVRREPFC